MFWPRYVHLLTIITDLYCSNKYSIYSYLTCINLIALLYSGKISEINLESFAVEQLKVYYTKYMY